MNILKREIAPVVDAAWKQIENDAADVLKANLSARRVVDFDGPRGFEFSAVPVGTLGSEGPQQGAPGRLRFGIRQVLPMVEVSVPFELDIRDLDNMARGAGEIDTTPVVRAAREVAAFEERAVYNGFEPGGIHGIAEATPHEAVRLGEDAARFPDAVARAVLMLNEAGVPGPFGLVLGPRPYQLLAGESDTFPPARRIKNMIDGPIVHSPVIEGGFLISLRGGDFRLTVGQDLAIGYERHDRDKVTLFLMETFTFRALGPEAAVRLTRA